MPLNKEIDLTLDTSRVIGLIAPQSYGKTTLLHLFAEIYSRYINVFVFDTDFERMRTYGDLSKNMHFIYPKDATMPKEVFLNETIKYIRSKYSNIAIIIEDYDKFLISRGKNTKNDAIYTLASDSRHQRIALIYTSKTPAYIPTTLRLNTNLFFIGKFTDTANYTYIKKMLPNNNMYDTLNKHEFVMIDNYTNTYSKIKYNLDKNTIYEV
ncbi:MAG: hypothetical protein QXU98_04165 [Candidatus Parvarchaeota archaeon]